MMSIALGAMCLALAGSLAQVPGQSSEHLTIPAREVLRKHCLQCHGGERPRGELGVLDHRLLIDPGRRLVIPGAPGRSRLLELIEDGSMPWGTRPKVPEVERQVLHAWIAAGAPAFSRFHSDRYVLGRILDDVRALPPEDRGHVRYLSLHHLLEEGDARQELELHRAALRLAVKLLSRPDRSGLRAFEPTDTVYRLDLRDLGWDQPVMKGPAERTLNRFDLLLLEYPYGLLHERSPLRAELEREFLARAAQVRPVLFVRGDWLVNALPALLSQPALDGAAIEKSRLAYGGPVRTAAAAAELDWEGPPADLQKQLRAPSLERLGLGPLLEGGTVSRDAWEKAFDPVVRTLKIDTPIVPLDGLTRPNLEPAREPFAFDVRIIDAQTRQARDRFVPGDRLLIEVRSDRDVYLELVWTTQKGEKSILPLQKKLVEAGKPRRIGPKDDEAYSLTNDLGTDQITGYAFPVEEFPSGQLFRGEGLADRLVHRFPADGPGKPSFDPAQVAKKTAVIEIRKP